MKGRLFGGVLIGLMVLAAFSSVQAAVWQLYEAEDFQSYGGWMLVGDGAASSDRYLQVPSSFPEPIQPDAITIIELPIDSTYKIWVRSRNYDTYSTQRTMRVVVDGVESEIAGAHPYNGWYWELVATMPLTGGQHLLQIRDVGGFYGRCDGVMFTDDPRSPNDLPLNIMESKRTSPIFVDPPMPAVFTRDSSPPAPLDTAAVATLQSNSLRVTFHQQQDRDGVTRIFRRTDLKADGQWLEVPEVSGSESVFLLYTEDTDLEFRHLPRWSTPTTFTVSLDGQDFVMQSDAGSPYQVSEAEELVPIAASQVDANIVEITFS
ncbi:hypothetical protein HQ520_02105, partial [bacterium]|nr:hypothetical protein [bacterium]